jgi:cytochrome bd-type quinol oxidase subunit 2
LLGMFCTSPLVRFFNDFGVGFLFEAGQQTWREDQNTQILTMIRHGWDMNWTGGWLVVWNIVHLAIPAHHTHTHTRKQRKT